MDFQVIFLAFFGGLLPALLWLLFWLSEDKVHPEPKRIIVATFIAGALAVAIVLPLQKASYDFLAGSTIGLFFVWALIEEVVKFLAAYFLALKSKALDEPIDSIIYMVTAALGFTAFENGLFLFSLLDNGELIDSIITGNLRFIGASLLHVMTSAIVGIFMAISFYKKRGVRRYMIFMGILLATSLHTVYNLFIISDSGNKTYFTFLVLWFSVACLLLFFEKVKTIKR